jgi:hypothetical protein
MIGKGRHARVDPAFDRFLQAPVDEDAPQHLLTVVSVLARLDLDPWHEAAVLATLSPDAAADRLEGLLDKLSDSAAVGRDPARVAARLVGLLPRAQRRESSGSGPPDRFPGDTQPETRAQAEGARTPASRGWSKGALLVLLLIVATVATFTGTGLDRWLGSPSSGTAEETTRPALAPD